MAETVEIVTIRQADGSRAKTFQRVVFAVLGLLLIGTALLKAQGIDRWGARSEYDSVLAAPAVPCHGGRGSSRGSTWPVAPERLGQASGVVSCRDFLSDCGGSQFVSRTDGPEFVRLLRQD